MKIHNEIHDLGFSAKIIMVIRIKSCSILGTFCFRVGSVIALAGARDLLSSWDKLRFFLKRFMERCLRQIPNPFNDLSKSCEIEKTSR